MLHEIIAEHGLHDHPENVALVGFSQGGIMALESTQESPAPASRVIAIAGRFARAPRIAPANVTLHLLHGQRDPVMASSLSVDAVQTLVALGAHATVELFPDLGHGIDPRVIDSVIAHLQHRRPDGRA